MPAFRWSELREERIQPEYSSARGSIFSGQKIAAGRYVYPAMTAVKPHAKPN